MSGRRRRRASAHAAAATINQVAAAAPVGAPSPSPLLHTDHASVSPFPSIQQLKLTLSSRIQSMQQEADHAHASLLKEVDASTSRLAKRSKEKTLIEYATLATSPPAFCYFGMQSCTQHANEADREWGAFCDDFKDDIDEIQKTSAEVVGKVQSMDSYYTKTAIPELMKSVQKTIEGLRSRYVLS